jgi:co-chaperonin GroES (HSP10)
MKKYIFEPAEQRVLVLPEEPEDRIGMIYVPDSIKKDKPQIGKIVEAGEGSKDHPMKYYAGQLVMFSQYAGSEVEMDLGNGKKTYFVMNQMDIWGSLTELVGKV